MLVRLHECDTLFLWRPEVDTVSSVIMFHLSLLRWGFPLNLAFANLASHARYHASDAQSSPEIAGELSHLPSFHTDSGDLNFSPRACEASILPTKIFPSSTKAFYMLPVYFFDVGSPCASQSLKLTVLLPQALQCWDYRCATIPSCF